MIASFILTGVVYVKGLSLYEMRLSLAIDLEWARKTDENIQNVLRREEMKLKSSLHLCFLQIHFTPLRHNNL